MEDCSSPQSFSSHHHHQHPSSQLTLPQSPGLGYPSPQPGLDPPQNYGVSGGQFPTSFLTSSTLPEDRRASGGDERGLCDISGSRLEGDANLESQLNAGGRHFTEANLCFTNMNDGVHTMNCANQEGVRHKVRANGNDYAHFSFEAQNEIFCHREANVSQLAKQTASINRSASGSFSDSSVDYGQIDSRVGEAYLGSEEDYGSSCGSGEDQLQPADVEGSWLSVSPLMQTRWRGTADSHSFPSACQRSTIGVSCGTSTQRLDSFSEAFLSQRKRIFPAIPRGDSSGQMWDFGVGRAEYPGSIKSIHSCAFDSESYQPSSSPAHPSLTSFPSPCTSAQLVSSVLSPPPTPRPPPTQSPSKMDSPSAFGGSGHSVSQSGDPLDVLQFFSSHLQSHPSIHSCGTIWRFPLLVHNVSPPGDPSNTRRNLGACHGGDYWRTAAPQIIDPPESSFFTSPHQPSALITTTTPSLHPSFHYPSHPPHQYETAVKTTVCTVTKKLKNGSGGLNQSQLQEQFSKIYTGTPFPSILHSSKGQKRGRHTPGPLLNPKRRGLGLYSSLSSLHHREEETGGQEHDVVPRINVGRDFQAELPPCCETGEGSASCSREEKSTWEQLLWKTGKELEEKSDSQDQVERLLSVCSSSCLPGGGNNMELALHCLHYCQGNSVATLDMLLFSQPPPTGDYHYTGSDFWTANEKLLFSAALRTHGKEFSLVQKTVRTKTTCQCVEYYYLSKKLQDMQKKQDLQKSIPSRQTVNRQIGRAEPVPAPSLASFFPCKLCGKMFYKIKSRNAHMKIHRQHQEDWSDRTPLHQLPTQVLSGNLLPRQAPARIFPSSVCQSNAGNLVSSVSNSATFSPSNSSVLDPGTMVTYGTTSTFNSQIITNSDEEANHRETTSAFPFNQLWGSFGHDNNDNNNNNSNNDPATFSCNTDGVGAGTEGRTEPIHWQ